MKESFKHTLDRQLNQLDWTRADACRVYQKIQEAEAPVRRRRLPAAAMAVLVLMLLTVTAVGAGTAIHYLTQPLAQMTASQPEQAWNLPAKLAFITVMKDAGLDMDEKDWALLTDEAQTEAERSAAADRIIYARYGTLQEQENAARPYPKESVVGEPPEAVIVFQERYMAEHPGATVYDQAYQDALGYWMRDEYLPQVIAALPSQEPQPRETETANLTEEDIQNSLRSDMTEVYSWPVKAAENARITVTYHAERNYWYAQGDVTLVDMEGALDPILEDERMIKTDTGYRLWGYYALDNDGNHLRAATEEELLIQREQQNSINDLHTIFVGDALPLAVKAVQDTYGLNEAEVSRYFVGSGDTYFRSDSVRATFLFRPHNNWANDWEYAVIVNLTTAQVDDIFQPDDLWDRLPLLADAYPHMTYDERLDHLRWYFGTYNPLYGFHYWPIERQAWASQLFRSAYEQEKAVMPEDQVLLDEFCSRDYALPKEDEISQTKAETIARQEALRAINAAYAAESDSRRLTEADIAQWKVDIVTFAYEASGQPVWRFWLFNSDLPGEDIRSWCVWLDGQTGEILESVQRMKGGLSSMV